MSLCEKRCMGAREVGFRGGVGDDSEKMGVWDGLEVVVNARGRLGEEKNADVGCTRAWGLFQCPVCLLNRLIVAQTDLVYGELFKRTFLLGGVLYLQMMTVCWVTPPFLLESRI